MLRMRLMQDSDLDALETFAYTAYTGLTSLPKDRKLLKQRISNSVDAVSKVIKEPGNQCYYFILEDTLHQAFAGVSGILALSGYDSPLHFYRIEALQREGKHLKKTTQMHLLKHVESHCGPSEICSLYLMPDYRKGGLGRLLSFSRFLFIALHPERFTDTIIAQMRGVIHKHNYSPFWEYVGKPFANIEFYDVMQRLSVEGKELIQDCLPDYPIYVELIHPEARAVIGKPHHNTRPALNLLENEGFQWDHEVDIFDAGPKISAEKTQVRCIRERTLTKVSQVLDKDPVGKRLLISNTGLKDFKACFGHIKETEAGEVMISRELAESLEIDKGSGIQYVNPFPSSTEQTGALYEQQPTSLH